MAHDREVGGIRCFEVLERLSDYLDEDVSEETRARIEAHLRGCDWCERFGGRFQGAVEELRQTLDAQTTVPREVSQRLARALDDEDASST